MKKCNIKISALELTKEEQDSLWHDYCNSENSKILVWDHDDGQNSVKLRGEDFYRQIVIKE